MKTYIIFFVLALSGCQFEFKFHSKPTEEKEIIDLSLRATYPIFRLGISDHPVWSTFAVASTPGCIHPRAGDYGELERKWKVDIVLVNQAKNTNARLFAEDKLDAVCCDIFTAARISSEKPSTAFLLTSISQGGDKLVSQDLHSLENLKGQSVFGSSPHLLYRALESKGIDPSFVHYNELDDKICVLAYAYNKTNIKNVVASYPHAYDYNSANSAGFFTSNVLATSKSFGGEFLEMVIISNESKNRKEGKAFMMCIAECYYHTWQRINDLNSEKSILAFLGESCIGEIHQHSDEYFIEHISKCLEDYVVCSSPEAGLEHFTGDNFSATIDSFSTFVLKYHPTTSISEDAESNPKLLLDPSIMKSFSQF